MLWGVMQAGHASERGWGTQSLGDEPGRQALF